MGKEKSHVKRSSPLVEAWDRAFRRDASLCGSVKADARLSCPVCHFERKREIFFVCRKTMYACEWKREACFPMQGGYGASCKRISRAGEEEDCNKNPSAALGMTIREEG